MSTNDFTYDVKIRKVPMAIIYKISFGGFIFCSLLKSFTISIKDFSPKYEMMEEIRTI